MRILFTVCGRAGSKGIKNKNIRNFVGKPLLYYTFSTIDLFLKNTNLNIQADVVVNSDSQELLKLAVDNGMVPIKTIERKPELAGDTVGKIAVIQDCLQQMQERKSTVYDMVIDMDITSPLRQINDLSRLIDKHLSTGADVTTSVAGARRNPYFNQVMKTEHGYKQVIKSNYTARQQAPEIFDMNASLYAYKPKYLLSGKGVLDGYCECIEMYDCGILDLDHENDFELMQVIAEYLYRTNKGFGEIRENMGKTSHDE